MDKLITNFPITVYGNMQQYNDTISRGRCRVFYKGRNRNGTYITPEFAEKLIASAPYTPVKGIYEFEDGDYTDHGKKRSEGRIYGVVPADHNFAWEQHEDDDGVMREYACFDVLYYSALYKEAREIHGKSESMELFRDTLKGEWQYIDGKKTYVFTDGCFLGLQALGDNVEPCFEGASFYQLAGEGKNLCEKEADIIALLEQYEKKIDLFNCDEQGGNTMPNVIFKISDGQKYEMLFSLLNPNYSCESGWEMDYLLCEVYEEYAIAKNLAEGIFERIYYTKDDSNDSLEITNKERCYIVDINEAEKQALETIKGENTYSQVVENIASKDKNIETLNETVNELNTKIEEFTANTENLTSSISELNTQIDEYKENISTLIQEKETEIANYEALKAEKEAFEQSYSQLQIDFDAISAEKAELASFKKDVEDEAKRSIVAEYVEFLDEKVIESYLNTLDNYSIDQLDMSLTYEQKKANPGLFLKQASATPSYLPKDEDPGRGINDILSKYERN